MFTGGGWLSLQLLSVYVHRRNRSRLSCYTVSRSPLDTQRAVGCRNWVELGLTAGYIGRSWQEREPTKLLCEIQGLRCKFTQYDDLTVRISLVRG